MQGRKKYNGESSPESPLKLESSSGEETETSSDGSESDYDEVEKYFGLAVSSDRIRTGEFEPQVSDADYISDEMRILNLIKRTVDCPTGLHPKANRRKPCICLNVKIMTFHRMLPVRREWHSLDGTPPQLMRYKVLTPAKLAVGGQGTVSWMLDEERNLEVAIKMKKRGHMSDENWKKELREIKFLEILNHSLILKLNDAFETDHALFLSLEYLPNGSLWKNIVHVGVLPEAYAVYYASCVLTALQYLINNNIVFRDLKSENVALDSNWRPKLIDFGMAKFIAPGHELGNLDFSKVEKPSIIKSDEDIEFYKEDLIHSPSNYEYAKYMAPEISADDEAVFETTDTWGLGYIMMEMVLGYGIFYSLPWSKKAEDRTHDSWKLKLPSEAKKRASLKCIDFLERSLRRCPKSRPTIQRCKQHLFFNRVRWEVLSQISGPDLSKFRNGNKDPKCRVKIDTKFVQNLLGISSTFQEYQKLRKQQNVMNLPRKDDSAVNP